jgi:hypothetical protein
MNVKFKKILMTNYGIDNIFKLSHFQIFTLAILAY